MAHLESDNAVLTEAFHWAAEKTRQFVMTGKTGPINDGRLPDRPYIPSYWAGYYHRTAFYIRDFVHQAIGAQLTGLAEENYRMLQAFARSATAQRKWYALWALNFDGTPYDIDYKSDQRFVREVPAQFELVETAWRLYQWSGDRRYLADDIFEFCTRTMTDFVSLHDSNGNGIPEGTGGSIFDGICTYNEHPGRPLLEAGDAVGAQYQAMLAYAELCRARGDGGAFRLWEEKAARLKDYFNDDWSILPEDPEGPYVRALAIDGVTRYNDYDHENSWFMPLKQLTRPGKRNDAYLDFITRSLGSGIGSAQAPTNIEAYTYLPQLFFLYDRNEEAWKWMRYIYSVRDLPHEVAAQGTNGNYPEISFTFVDHVVEGLMGLSADVGSRRLTTLSRLPDEIGHAALCGQVVGENRITVTHHGRRRTCLRNQSGAPLLWTACFPGEHREILVDSRRVPAQRLEICGVPLSAAELPVETGQEVRAELSL